MENFAQLTQDWQMFYATIATSSATLVGLLFVALSLNVGFLTRPDHVGLRLLARQTFTTFLLIIAIALTFLIPHQTLLGIGVPLVANGVIGIILTLRDVRVARAHSDQAIKKYAIVRRSLFKIAAFAALIIVSSLLAVQSNANLLDWLVAPMILLIISASLNTWVLLMAVHEAKKRD